MKRRGFLRGLLTGAGAVSVAPSVEARKREPEPESDSLEIAYNHPNAPTQRIFPGDSGPLGRDGVIFAPEVRRIFLDSPKDGMTVYKAMSDFLDRPENMFLEAPFTLITETMFEMNGEWRFADPSLVKAALINHNGDLALINAIGCFDVNLRWQLDDGLVRETEYMGPQFFHVKGSGTLKVWTNSPWPTWFVMDIAAGLSYYFPIAPAKIPLRFDETTRDAIMPAHVAEMRRALGDETALKEIRRHEKQWWHA